MDEAGDVGGGGSDGGGSGGGTSSVQQINSIVPCGKRITTKWISTFQTKTYSIASEAHENIIS